MRSCCTVSNEQLLPRQPKLYHKYPYILLYERSENVKWEASLVLLSEIGAWMQA